MSHKVSDKSKSSKSPLVIYEKDMMVFIYGKAIKISTPNFRLLYYLYKNRYRVISLEELNDLFHYPRDKINTVVVRIYRLRKVLSEYHAESWIEAVRGVGYRLLLPD
ncbi:winged helix-turn-helix domain-containing protein [Acidithiobacillus sp. AMEEHan]|uniref:winged helix-turn-helix domain-containing protein n=1 Tax=Acidithiobacillus sp. AMEEHan TaxID=2994951 RepID=UPI0027E49A58|nr:winged helix-turn-helix domain-containing protein [Acidithiobacillus sp. AMEEHan]